MASLSVYSSIIIILCVLASNVRAQIAIQTDKGLVQGQTELVGQTEVHKYLGIPYAQPPIGAYRFKPPQPLSSSWSGVLNASQYRSSCMQYRPVFRSPIDSPESIISENCLFINVFTTSPSTAANKSVMVWIHGGGYLVGSGANWQPQTFTAMEDIVVVTMNYRLGIFGFFTSGEPDPNNRNIQANLGFLDQQLALQWVQNNIENFGGNKDAVTIAGFSAGSYSVEAQLLAPSSRGLYRYAIMESGAELDVIPIEQARQTFFRAGQKANCSSSDTNVVYQCLNKLNSATMSDVGIATFFENARSFGMVVDNRFILENPRTSLQNGRFNKARLLIGTTLDDAYIFIPQVVSRQTFLRYVNNRFPYYPTIARATIINRYTNYNAIDSPQANRVMLGQLANDLLFLSTSDFVAQQYSKYVPTYNYVWTYRTLETGYVPPYAGVGHGVDVPYFFGYPIQKPAYYNANFTAAEVQLSRDTMPLWGNFIRTGNPSTSKVTWPEYTSAAPYCLNISLQSFTVLSDFKRNSIAFFNQYLIQQFGAPYNLTKTQTTAPPMITTPKMMTTATATIAQDSSFRTATFALIGVSAVLLALVVILLAMRCCSNRNGHKV